MTINTDKRWQDDGCASQSASSALPPKPVQPPEPQPPGQPGPDHPVELPGKPAPEPKKHV